jgi:hypothetical protein
MIQAGKIWLSKWLTRSLLGCITLLSVGVSKSETPWLPPLSKEEYLKTRKPFVYTGRFVRLVQITRELDEKLYDKNSTITLDELRMYEVGEQASAGTQFMEIGNARVVLAHPEEFKGLYRKDCSFERIYVPLSSVVDLKGDGRRAAHYRSLLGKDVVLLTFGRYFYGRNPVDFPKLVFMGAEGMGDHVAPSILPLADLPDLSSATRKWGYVDAQANLCTRN